MYMYIYIGWKENRCHPFNSRRGRFKGPKNSPYTYTYNMGSKFDSFLRKSCFLFCFVHIVLLISLEIMRKNYMSRFILQGRNIILKNILRVRCSLRKIK